MMEHLTIRNSSDLKSEILRLEEVSKQQGEALKVHFNSPGAIFSTMFSLFSRPSDAAHDKGEGIFSQDFLGLISRVILPLFLNKTIFRHSNFLIKTLVGLVSQKASNYISEDSVGSVWHKLRSVVDEYSGDIIKKVSSVFESKKPKRAANHPAYAPVQRNVLKDN